MSYSPWDNIESGKAPGTVKGLLPLDNAATAFAYRKEIYVQTPVDGVFGVSFKDLRGTWKVRIRSDAGRDKEGHYSGSVLFEQVVSWTARVVTLNLGGLALVTWQPLGDGGNGKLETSVVDLQPCATIASVSSATEAEMEEYGETGAWRFLDLGTLGNNATDRQKYDVEQGRAFTLFESEGRALPNGSDYIFYAKWQSPYYRCYVPPGAILETVEDHWQSGNLTTEAFYTFSSQQISSEAALFDIDFGSHFRIFTAVTANGAGNGTGGAGTAQSQVWRSRQLRSYLTSAEVNFEGESDTSGLGVVEYKTRLQGLHLAKVTGGVLLALGATGGTASMLRVFVSIDQGEHWKRIMNQPLDLVPLASCVVKDGAQVVVYGVNSSGRAKYAILSFSKVTSPDGKEVNGWKVSDEGEVERKNDVELPTKGVGSLTECGAGVLRLAARDPSGIGAMILLISRDGGRSYDRESLT